MNPWKIIGWIVLAVVVLTLGFCAVVVYQIGDASDSSSPTSSSSSALSLLQSAQPAAPTYVIKIVSVECNDNYGRNRADVTVTNAGGTTIPYAKAFVQFRDGNGKVLSARDSYFSPTDIPPGATASATVYSSGGGAKTCGVTAVQDGDGNGVEIQ